MANEFKPNVGGKVAKSDAQKWIAQYDNDHRKIKDKDTKSVFFGRDMLQEILNTPDAAGISFFFAKKDNVTLVLVPTKEDGTLIWPSFPEGKDAGDGAYDSGRPCPPYCPS